MGMSAEELNDRGNEHLERGRWDEAETTFRKAIAAEPQWSPPWYNLGLLYKRQREWQKSLDANLKATELNPSDKPAFWNLGIAATALSDWTRARAAWKGFGAPIPDGEGPLEMKLGLVPIRLDPEDKGEVVWCDRIDPARSRIVNVPLPESDYREGDIVLHDGVPHGYREHDGKRKAVFDALGMWQRSGRSTFRIEAHAPAGTDAEALVEIARESGICIDDWTGSVRRLCRYCSEGTPHEEHVWVDVAWAPDRKFGGSASDRQAIDDVLAAWTAGSATRRVERVSGP
jgi:hypothetical protein